MVKLDKIYTRGGDGGETSLGDGSRVTKHDQRVAATGSVDHHPKRNPHRAQQAGCFHSGDRPREQRLCVETPLYPRAVRQGARLRHNQCDV
jgi:hypothetical protein